MAIPTFDPPVAPSYESSRTEAIRRDEIRTIKYTQYRPLGVRPLKRMTLRWNGLTKAQLSETISFFHDLEGGIGPFYWQMPEFCVNPILEPTFTTAAGGSLSSRAYWIAYSWYHNSSGEETTESAFELANIPANELITITVPVIPLPADRTRIYADQTNGAMDLKLQATLDPGVRTWTEPATGLIAGASPPTSNTLWQPHAWILAGPVSARKFTAETWRLSIDLLEQLRIP